MGTLTTTIKLNDQFSKALGAINTKINKTIQLAERMNRTTGSTKYADLLKLEVRLKEKEIALTKLQNENELKVANATEKTAQANKKVEELKKQIDLDLSKTLRAEEKKNAEIQRAIRSENQLKNTQERRKLLAEQIEGKIRLQNNALEIQKQKYQGIFGQLQAWASKLRNILTIYYAIRGAVQAVGASVKLSDKMTMTDAKFNLVAEGDPKLAGDLKEKTFYAAQRSTTDYLEFGKAVGKLGVLAGDKFANTDSIVKFVELMNKSFQISGAETSERNAAMLQITQAIASNRLQGDEFRSILENAPMVMEALTRSLGVGHDKLKAMAKEGEITADVLIKAMFDAGSKIETMYKQLDMTWERHWTKMKNVGVLAFEPIHEQLKRLFKSEKFQKVINGICTAMIVLGNLGGKALKWLLDGISKLYDGFEKLIGWVKKASGVFRILRDVIVALTIATAIYGAVWLLTHWRIILMIAGTALLIKLFVWFTKVMVAVTLGLGLLIGAFYLLANAKKLASVWAAVWGFITANAIYLIIGVIALVIYAIYKMSDSWADAFGKITACIAMFLTNLRNTFAYVWNFILTHIEFLVNCWEHGTYSVKKLFASLAINMLDYIVSLTRGWDDGANKFAKSMVEAINVVIGAWNKLIDMLPETVVTKLGLAKGNEVTAKDVSNIASKAEKLKAELQASIADVPEGYKSLDKFKMEYKDLSEVAKKWYDKGEGVGKYIDDTFDKFDKMVDEFKKQMEELKKVELNGDKVTADALNGIDNKLGDGNNYGANTAKNTGDTAKNTSKTNDYSYLRDWYYQKGLGNSIGYNIKIEQNNRNNVASNLDLDKIADALIDKFMEGLNIGREGARI